MTLDEIRQVAAPILGRYGVRYAGVFGSVARGDSTADSDVDVLVVLKQPVSLLKFFALNDELETALGCKVDLVTRDSLNPRVRRLALEELRTVYEEVR
jgi:predicted nucleotidyltransferase